MTSIISKTTVALGKVERRLEEEMEEERSNNSENRGRNGIESLLVSCAWVSQRRHTMTSCILHYSLALLNSVYN